MLRRAAGWLMVGFGSACAPLVAPPAEREPPPSARFTSSGFELRFPRDACGQCRLAGDSVPNRFAGPAWVVLVRPDTGWLAGALQVFPDRTLHLPVTDSLPALLRAATALECDLATLVMACGTPLHATATAAPMAVVVRITEGRWRRRLRVGRPDSLTLAFRQRNTETPWHRRIAIEYADQ